MTPGMNWLSGLRSKKLRPMQSPISIPTGSGRVIRATMAWETATPVSTGARPALSGRWTICIASALSASRKTFARCCRSFWSGRSPTSKAIRQADYSKHGSLLFGDMGAALLAMRLAPTSSLADLVHTRAEANMGLPIRELMWGMPGSMLAAIHMAEMTAGNAMARPVRNAGGPAVGRAGGHAARSTLDTGSLW